MQRTGRKGHTQFRVIVQDSRFSPTSGRVVAYLGSYDPHAKTTTLDKDKAKTYLSNGAQPSERVVRLLKSEGVKLPSWASKPSTQKRVIKNSDKLRRNRPAGAPAPAAEVAEQPAAEAESTEAVEPTAEETAAAPDAAPETEAVSAEPEAEAAAPEAKEPTAESKVEPAEVPDAAAEAPEAKE